MIKLNEDDARNIYWDELSADSPYQFVEEGGWKDDGGDRQYNEAIFKEKQTGKTYGLTAFRAGSAYSEWHYWFDLDCPEVAQVEVVQKVWKKV